MRLFGRPMADPLRLFLDHVSVRDYTEEAIPDDTWRALVRAAQQCSTDATGQLYSLVELASPQVRQRVSDLIGDQPFMMKAARVALFCLDVRRLRRLLEHRGHEFGMGRNSIWLFGMTDLGLFAQTLALACEAMGYGICFLGSVQNHSRAIASFLGLPQGVVPMYGITVGRPVHQRAPRPRLPTEHVLHVDGYQDLSPSELDRAFAAMAPATRSGNWLNPLRKYFGVGGVMAQREEEIEALLRQQGLG